jgi:pimeloyl-ACP methyl ester carboxylesterase
MKKRIAIICLILVVIGQQQAVYATENKEFTEYSITIGSYELYGRLIMPQGAQNPPVAILIHGSGQGNYNSAFGGMAFFYDIAQGLAEQGIASIRFNKRHRQHPPLPPDATIFTETIYDVHYAIDFARDHTGLGEIFLIGFSQGGIVAPHIAYGRPEVAGIVSLAGSPRNFIDIIASQSGHLHYRAEALGLPIPSFIPADFILRWVMAVDEEAMPDAFSTFNNIALALGFPISFLRSMEGLSVHDIIDQVQIPFLILQGEKDLQVFAAYDFVAWQDMLYNRENVTFILYEGLNHFFAPHVEELGFNQFRANVNVDAQVINDIANWILNLP